MLNFGPLMINTLSKLNEIKEEEEEEEEKKKEINISFFFFVITGIPTGLRTICCQFKENEATF